MMNVNIHKHLEIMLELKKPASWDYNIFNLLYGALT